MLNKFFINLIMYIILTSFFIYIWINEKKIGLKIKLYRNIFSEYIIRVFKIKKKVAKNTIKKLINTTETIITAVVLVLIIQYFYIGNFMVPTGSMMPTIMLKERFFGDMVSYRFRMPKLGEIIVFREPIRNKDLYTKRLVGLPGDEVRIMENGNLVVNNEIIEGKVWEDKLYANSGYVIHGKKVNSHYNGDIVFYTDLNNLFRLEEDNAVYSMNSESQYVDFSRRIFIDNKVYYNSEMLDFRKGDPYCTLNLPNNLGLKVLYSDLYPVLFLNGVSADIVANKEEFYIENKTDIFIENYNNDTKFKLTKDGKLLADNNIVKKIKRRYTAIGYIGKNTWYVPKKGDDLTIIGNFDSTNYGDRTINVEKLQNMLSDTPELVMSMIPSLKFYIGNKETGPILDVLKDKDIIEKLNNNGKVTIKLSNNYYMALGDNTNNSFDSRFWGMINEKKIRGRTVVRFWPLNKIGIVR